MMFSIGGLVVGLGAIVTAYLLEGSDLGKLRAPTLALWVLIGAGGFTLASYRPGVPRAILLGRLSRNFWIMGLLLAVGGWPMVLIGAPAPVDVPLLLKGCGYSLLGILYGGVAAMVTDAFNPPGRPPA